MLTKGLRTIVLVQGFAVWSRQASALDATVTPNSCSAFRPPGLNYMNYRVMLATLKILSEAEKFCKASSR